MDEPKPDEPQQAAEEPAEEDLEVDPEEAEKVLGGKPLEEGKKRAPAM